MFLNCAWEKEDFKNNNAFPLCDFFGHGGHDIFNFGRPFLGHLYYTFSLSESMAEIPVLPIQHQTLSSQSINLNHSSKYRCFLKKYINLTFFTPKLPSLGMGGGVMKFTIFCPLTLYMLIHTKFGQDYPSSC